MNTKKIFSLALATLLITIALSCDPAVCGFSRVVNDTEHQVLIKAYYYRYSLWIDSSAIAPYGNTVYFEACGWGTESPPFSIFEIYRTVDSVDVVFNGTHYTRYYHSGYECVCRNPISGMCYEPVNGKPNYYEYHITEADFQDAIEIN